MKNKASLLLPLLSLCLMIALSACSKASTSSASEDDSSSSGFAASAVGGALSASNSGGTLAAKTSSQNPLSFLSTASASSGSSCPTFRTTAGSGCTASGSTLWLDLSDCSYGSSLAAWNGIGAITKSNGSAACGTFPNPGANGTLVRQFVTAVSGTTPGTATRTSAAGIKVTLDDAAVNLGNFDGDTISTIANGGYGTKVTFNSAGARSQIDLGMKIYLVGAFNHSLTGSVFITEAAADSGSRTITGSLKLYHNLLKVIATSTFNSVGHSDVCCVPVSGSITTAFTAGTASPTTPGSLLVGKSEVLTFTGCGTGTLQKTDGTSVNVALNHCF